MIITKISAPASGTTESDGDFLCVGCIERRLGRMIGPDDFTAAPINEPSPWDTPRSAARKAGELNDRRHTAIHEAAHAVIGRARDDAQACQPPPGGD
jgi:hypothetical protein